MFGFSLILVIVVLLLVAPLVIVAISYFHWLGEKREKEALECEAEEFRRDCDARLGPMRQPLPENGTATEETGKEENH
jgi:hypothetical protein